MRVLGLMSGTSLDGVDAAIIETDGENVAALGPARTFAYTDDERQTLQRAIADALDGADPSAPPPSFAAAADVIDLSHTRAVRELLADASAGPVQLIGFHGQTVIHRPEASLCVQLGRAESLARATGIDVVWDLRGADVAAGGQGAPIVPAYHRALAQRAELARPLAILNVGGVANVTYIDRSGELLAFDTGPGNGLIDSLVEAHGVGRFDAGGRLAATGTVDATALEQLLDHPYFRLGGAKSLDRYDFSIDPVRCLALADAAATLVAFTVVSIGLALDRLPDRPKRCVVCGGGRHNRTLMTALNERLKHDFAPAEAVGWRGDSIEAEAMGFLAVRSVRGLPLTFSGTTGVTAALTGGRRAAA